MAISQAMVAELRLRTIKGIEKTGIHLFDKDKQNIEIADFGLAKPEKYGVQLVIYVDNDRYCVKDVIMFPGQTVPEHKHPKIEGNNGKCETFHCKNGTLYLYVPGTPTENIHAKIEEEKRRYFSVFHEIILKPGDQYTIEADTLHWFQAGPEGAVFAEYSTANTDELDQYTDPEVRRIPENMI